MNHPLAELAQWVSILSTLGALLWMGGRKAHELDDHARLMKELKDSQRALAERERELAESVAVCEAKTALLQRIALSGAPADRADAGDDGARAAPP